VIVKGTLSGAWDVLCAANMLLDDRVFVTPTWNMVQNIGLEHGTHAQGTPDWSLVWEPPPPGWAAGEVRFAPAQLDDRVLRAYRRFFKQHSGDGRLGRADAAFARWRAVRLLRSSRP
jgi:hypothetical protein